MQIAQAIMNGATTVTKAASEYAWPFNLIPIGFAVAETAIQVGTIKKQTYEGAKYEKGGYLDGPSHSQDGMPVINHRTGRKEAEVEGGEVILSKKTVRNNPSLVSALLDSSINKNGAIIQPWFKTRAYQAIDYAGLTKTVQKMRFYESSGVFATAQGAVNNQQQQPIVVPSMTEEQELLMKALLQKMSESFESYVVYNSIEAKRNKLENIQSEASFTKQWRKLGRFKLTV